MNDFSFSAYVADRVSRINGALDRLTPAADAHPAALHSAMRYSLLAGGKRIRPLLCVAAAEAVGAYADDVLPTACALEMIHTFSLIHDDLPAIDNDDLRRGRATVHRQFGEALAILAGDALHTLAFTTLATHQSAEDPRRIVAVIREIADASGTAGMVGGQVDDIAAEGQAITADRLRSIHARKTGALLNASLQSGAILAGASEEQRAALRAYGDQIGVAFQIIDDVLDVVGDDATLGKPAGSDARHDKATYPKLFGIPTSTAMAQTAAADAISALAGFGDAANPLRSIARVIVERDR